MYRVLIDGQELDLDQASKIILNKTLIDLEDWSKRGKNFTNQFTAPNTGNNLNLLGNPEKLASNNNAFERKYNYQLIGSSGLVSSGDAFVVSYDDKKGTKIQMVESFDFWERCSKKRLNDLVIHDYDFLFNDANMDALKVFGSSPFVTALHSATGNNTDTALVDYTYTRPMYRFKRIMDLIASDLGYTIDYGVTQERTELFESGCMSNAVDFFVTDFKRRFQNVLLSGNIVFANGSIVIPDVGNTTVSGVSSMVNTQYATGYVIKGTVTSNISTSINITFSNRVEKIPIEVGENFINYRSDANEINETVTISCPDELLMKDLYVYTSIREGDIFSVESDITLTGQYIMADYNLPLKTYKDFIKDLLKLFFLDISVNDQTKEIKLIYLSGKLNKNNITDMSGRVNRDNIIDTGKIYGKLNLFTYDNDNDVDSDLGRVYFNVNNERAKEVKELISVSSYSASNEFEVSNNIVVNVPIYEVDKKTRQSVTNRVVYFDEVGSFGINARFGQMSWERLYSNHYFDFINSTKRERVMTLRCLINDELYKRLQKNPLIYVDFLESVFFTGAIENYDDKQLTDLKVVRFN